jgi:hypothetical protein
VELLDSIACRCFVRVKFTGIEDDRLRAAAREDTVGRNAGKLIAASLGAAENNLVPLTERFKTERVPESILQVAICCEKLDSRLEARLRLTVLEMWHQGFPQS